MFPGRTEFIEKYGLTVNAFHDRGFACTAIDWRGQGLADRIARNPILGHVENYTDYQQDVAALMAHVEALDLPKPYFVLAHSMGGPIALRALMNGLPVNACAFSAPFWGVQADPLLRLGGWTVTSLATWLGKREMLMPGQSDQLYFLREKFEDNTLTNDRERWDMLMEMAKARPELHIAGPTVGWLYTALRETLSLSKLPSPDVPCLTYVGTNEQTVDVDRIKARMANWPGGELRIIAGGKHEMLMDAPEMCNTLIDGYTAHFEAHLT